MASRLRAWRGEGRARFVTPTVLGGLAIAAAFLATGAGATGRTTPKFPTVPNCTRFLTRKVDLLLGTGHLYLVHGMSAGPDSNCTYYGVSAPTATKLATTSVPPTKIKYYPSLQISILTSTPALLVSQLALLHGITSDVERVARPVSAFAEEWLYSTTQIASDQPQCQPGILYDNWVGGPECNGEPALKKVGVLAWVRLSSSLGRIVLVGAAQQSPPGSLSISHVVALAEASVEGRLY